MKQGVNNTVIFFSFLIAQLLVSNFIDFGPMLFIVLYPLFILTLPVGLSLPMFFYGHLPWEWVPISYITGCRVCSASAVMMAFLRQPVQGLLIRKGELDSQIRPGIAEVGLSRFLAYALICLTIHHLTYIFAESFSFVYFSGNLPRLLISLAVNLALLLLLEFGVFYKNWK